MSPLAAGSNRVRLRVNSAWCIAESTGSVVLEVATGQPRTVRENTSVTSET